jgi:hypothetical protein
MQDPTTYTEAAELLGSKDSRKIANNTTLVRLADDRICVRLHRTVVVEFRADGTTRLDSGGWRTVTTKERLNRYMPPGYRIGAVRRVWFLFWLGERVGEFSDGLVIETRREVQA